MPAPQAPYETIGVDMSLSQTLPLLIQEGGSIAGLLPLVMIFGVFYFVMMRPQQRKLRMQRELISSIKQGDRIVAAGGIVGTVRRVDDDIISLQVAENVVIKVDRAAVSRKLEG